MASVANMQTYAARLETFHEPQHPNKRRASSQNTKRKNAQSTAWPHDKPTPEDLARAGFFFHPSLDNPDNVKCFFCEVKLDGWEPEDRALDEHIAHASTCSWAQALHAGRSREPDAHNPMSEEHVQIRTNTFTHGSGWPHENKRGWKCKIKKMVEAGWIFDPSPDYDDGVTCFYCELSLDGWEPKDDPAAEHRKRAPDCAFFALAEKHDNKGSKKSKKTKGRGQNSNASQASRLSTQSSVSVLIDMPDDITAQLDDSFASTDTATAQGVGKSKKPAKSKAAPKSTKSRKRANTIEDSTSENPSTAQLDAVNAEMAPVGQVVIASAPANTKAVRQPQILSDEKDGVPNKPKGKKKVVVQEPESHVESPPTHKETNVWIDTEVAAQLQDELDQSIDEIALEHRTPSPIPTATTKPKRGTKRMSDGSKKDTMSDSTDIAVVNVDQPEIVKAKKAQTKKAKTKNAASVRSSAASVATNEQRSQRERAEDLVRDEAEIEAELSRIAAEEMSKQRNELIEMDLGEGDEYESTPSRPSRHSKEIHQLEKEIDAESRKTPSALRKIQIASPCGSDKENVPSSVIQPRSGNRPSYMSPTKTMRVPLAPGTPTRSPTKLTQNAKLISSVPWAGIDLDAVFLDSPQPTPQTLRQRLANVTGALSSPEKQMSIEQWVRWRAEQGEMDLRRQCEEMVGLFEKEGMKALRSLEGIATL